MCASARPAKRQSCEGLYKRSKKNILDANMSRNGKRLKSDVTGRYLSRLPGRRHSAQVDHIRPKDRGGTNSYGNAQVAKAFWNNSKNNRYW